MNKMQKIISILIFLVIALLTAERSYAPPGGGKGAAGPQLIDYTAYPPFMSQQVPSNVLIMLDNSGSMNEFAYKTPGKGGVSGNPDNSYVPYDDETDNSYYGYFNPLSRYSYSANAGGHFYEDAAGSWDGNFLNWLTMRRVDIVKKVLVGGKATPRSGGVPNYLYVDGSDRDFYKKYADAGAYTPFAGERCFKNFSHNIYVSPDGTCNSFTAGTYNIKMKFSNTDEPYGLIQRSWENLRFGLMLFNDQGAKYEEGDGYDGGYVADWIKSGAEHQTDKVNTGVNIMTKIENMVPATWTPLGESFYEATRYIRGGTGAYRNDNYSAHDCVQYACQKNFVLILTDGESTKDKNMPGGNWGSNVADPMGFNVKTYMDSIAVREGYASQYSTGANAMDGTYYLEGVAYWAHTNDMRSDYDGVQSITTYSVFAFDDSATGRDLLKKTSKYGGFEDSNGNNIPDLQDEWDEDNDGNPDTFYEAAEGTSLETALIDAFTDMIRRTSSGTAVSMLATTGEGEGAVYQAYFYPEKIQGLQSRTWLGYLHALFVDKYGNLREDSNGNKALDYAADRIIETEYTQADGTVIKLYSDMGGDGVKDNYVGQVTVDDVNAIWKGGEKLWQTSPDDRTIHTSINGTVTVAFTAANKTTLKPYLRAADDIESENIIEWIRGDDLTGITDSGHTAGYRKRSITINNVTNVWKLGDIVHSTPSIVAKPMDNYDLLYNDASYANFYNTHKKRRQVVYVGANDGMLHAFNGGCYNAGEHKYYTDVDSSGNCVAGNHPLGQELWAFIPRGLLPHLKWNTLTNYTHVYHVDMKPKVADVKIFNADAVHPGGWGTILIGGFRYGGKSISWTSGANYSASPEYFALDVTDPLNPRLLWTFSDSALGLSMSYPSLAKVGESWFVVFGSGPTNYDTNSNITAFQSGNVFALKISGGVNGVVNAWGQNTNFWKIPTGNASTFLSDPIGVDVDIDYDVDVIYIGENIKTGANWNALMKRITTDSGDSANPSSWVLSTAANVNTIAGANDVAKRITSAPSAAMDDMAKLWVYFGTGQFLGSNDKNVTDSGAFYAIKDGCWDGSCTTSYSTLFDVSGAVVDIDGNVSGLSGGCGTASSWTELINVANTCDGWAMYFKNVGEAVDYTGNALAHNGERVHAKPVVVGGLVIWPSYVPGTDLCAYEGRSNVYAVYYKTGTAYREYVFKEQQTEANPSDNVARVMSIEEGWATSPSVQITKSGTAKSFIQQSTGNIIGFESITPLSIKSGVAGWKSEEIQ
ncbi:MAG: hypothetical protein HZA16_03015 [Nitrospirae bacterium]|nr:hypothetical protein [Nitrospirota bacterium]